jgi:hypothetical protein
MEFIGLGGVFKLVFKDDGERRDWKLTREVDHDLNKPVNCLQSLSSGGWGVRHQLTCNLGDRFGSRHNVADVPFKVFSSLDLV